MRAASRAESVTNMASSPIIFTTRPPPAVTVSWATSSKRRHHGGELLLGELLAERGEAHHVGEAHGQDGEGAAVVAAAQQHGPAHRRLDVAPPHELEQPGHGGQRVVGQLREPVGRLHACRRTPGPTPAMPRTAGDTSASAMRAIEDPMTRANCRLVSTSATPRSIIDAGSRAPRCRGR